MRSFFVAAAALCGVVSASPVAPWEKLAPPPAGTQIYKFQVKSSDTAVTNQWVSLKSGSTQYSLSSAQADGAGFFMTAYANTFAVHNSDDTRQVVLQGTDSILLYLNDATNPSESNIPKGQLMEWATFTVDNNVLGVRDGSALLNRTFVAVKNANAYTLAFYDGVSATTQTLSPVTINIVMST